MNKKQPTICISFEFDFLLSGRHPYQYGVKIGDNHHVQVLGGYQWEDGRFFSGFSLANNMVSNDLYFLNFGNDLTKVNTQTIETFAYQSYFGRINYSFADKYLFEAALRVDETRPVCSIGTKESPRV